MDMLLPELTQLILKALQRACRGLRLPIRLGGLRLDRLHHEEVHLAQLTAARPRHEQSFLFYAQIDQLLPTGHSALLRELVLDRQFRG